jgi:hypothetical protein
MKPVEIVVEEVQVSELRKELRQRLDFKQPLIVRRNSQPIGILFAVETSYYGNLDNPTRQKSRLRAELEAVLDKLIR